VLSLKRGGVLIRGRLILPPIVLLKPHDVDQGLHYLGYYLVLFKFGDLLLPNVRCPNDKMHASIPADSWVDSPEVRRYFLGV
jgi:hypothetical protein